MAMIGAVAACSNSSEKVFTRQNQAASALATMVMEAEARSPAKVDKIYEAEHDLHAACAPLREVASRRMAGESVGLDTQFVAYTSLDRCETETQRVEEFIRFDNPTVARTYLSPTYAPEARK
jgi:hypothetical protein